MHDAQLEPLARAGVFGRIASSAPDGHPHVIPVNYAVSDAAILVRTTADGCSRSTAGG